MVDIQEFFARLKADYGLSAQRVADMTEGLEYQALHKRMTRKTKDGEGWKVSYKDKVLRFKSPRPRGGLFEHRTTIGDILDD